MCEMRDDGRFRIGTLKMGSVNHLCLIDLLQLDGKIVPTRKFFMFFFVSWGRSFCIFAETAMGNINLFRIRRSGRHLERVIYDEASEILLGLHGALTDFPDFRDVLRFFGTFQTFSDLF